MVFASSAIFSGMRLNDPLYLALKLSQLFVSIDDNPDNNHHLIVGADAGFVHIDDFGHAAP